MTYSGRSVVLSWRIFLEKRTPRGVLASAKETAIISDPLPAAPGNALLYVGACDTPIHSIPSLSESKRRPQRIGKPSDHGSN